MNMMTEEVGITMASKVAEVMETRVLGTAEEATKENIDTTSAEMTIPTEINKEDTASSREDMASSKEDMASSKEDMASSREHMEEEATRENVDITSAARTIPTEGSKAGMEAERMSEDMVIRAEVGTAAEAVDSITTKPSTKHRDMETARTAACSRMQWDSWVKTNTTSKTKAWTNRRWSALIRHFMVEVVVEWDRREEAIHRISLLAWQWVKPRNYLISKAAKAMSQAARTSKAP